MIIRTVLLLVSVFALGLMSGCGGSDGPGNPDPTDTTVDAAGGTLTFAGGAVTMVFPANAVDNEITVEADAQGTYPANAGYVDGTCYDFTPEGTIFQFGVTVTIAYDEADLPAGVQESALALCKIVGSSWTAVPGSTVDTAANTVSAVLGSFSSYGIIGTMSGSGVVHEGNYYIYDAATLDNFQQYTSINGTLEIRSDAPDSVSLPNLETITGDLDLYGPGAIAHNLEYVRIPNLTSVSSNLIINNCDSLRVVELPECDSAGSIVIKYNAVLESLPGLSDIADLNPFAGPYLGHIEVRDNDELRDLGCFAGLGGPITGSITLYDNPSLVSVAGLAGISTVNGSFTVEHCHALTNLAGVGLASCGLDVIIRSNNGLTSLTGLEHLHTVSRGLSVTDLRLITDLTGLSSLTHVGALYVRDNSDLVSLDGLGSITQFSIALNITDNRDLTDITALSGLITVGHDIRIQHNILLETLDGLDSLAEIGGSLLISENAHLKNLNALSSVNHIVGQLHIYENWVLTSIEALHGLQVNTSTGYVLEMVNITENTMAGGGGSGTGLLDARAWAFIDAIGGAGAVEFDVTITGNG